MGARGKVIYVLRGANGAYYVGQATDFEERLGRHAWHICTRATKPRAIHRLTVPLEVIFVSESLDGNWDFIEGFILGKMREWGYEVYG